MAEFVDVAGVGGLLDLSPPPGVDVAGVGVILEVEIVYPVQLWLDDIDTSAYINQIALEAGVKSFLFTSFDSVAEEQKPTTVRWAFPVGGPWSLAVDALLGPWALRRQPLTVRVKVQDVRYSWVVGFLVDYRVTAQSPREGLVWMAALAFDRAPERST